MPPKPPWSIRSQGQDAVEDFFVLREGIPEGLLESLVGFVERHYCDRGLVVYERTEHLARILGRSLPTSRRALLDECYADADLLLDALDHALAYPPRGVSVHKSAAELEWYFRDARSVYSVNRVGQDEWELVYRQPPEVTKIVEQVTSERGRASEHLRSAWSLTFSRNSDPNAACIEAVKAVEAAARGTIEPKNPKATLGTMIAAIKSKPDKWETDLAAPDIDDVGTVLGMMETIWKGHLRHGNPDEPLEVPMERCEMIVHAAAILVHWFQSKKVWLA